MADRLLKQKEVIAILGVSPKTLQKWRRNGRIRAVSFGYRSIRIRQSEVERIEQEGIDARRHPRNR